MYIAKLSLVCLIAFAFILGCGLLGDRIEEVTLDVTGMTWGNCTSAVQDALTKVTGVSKVISVSMDNNTAVVEVKKGKVTTDALIKAVEADPRFKATVAN